MISHKTKLIPFNAWKKISEEEKIRKETEKFMELKKLEEAKLNEAGQHFVNRRLKICWEAWKCDVKSSIEERKIREEQERLHNQVQEFISKVKKEAEPEQVQEIASVFPLEKVIEIAKEECKKSTDEALSEIPEKSEESLTEKNENETEFKPVNENKNESESERESKKEENANNDEKIVEIKNEEIKFEESKNEVQVPPQAPEPEPKVIATTEKVISQKVPKSVLDMEERAKQRKEKREQLKKLYEEKEKAKEQERIELEKKKIEEEKKRKAEALQKKRETNNSKKKRKREKKKSKKN